MQFGSISFEAGGSYNEDALPLELVADFVKSGASIGRYLKSAIIRR